MLRKNAFSLFFSLVALAVLGFIYRQNYLLFHMLVELFGITVAWGIFLLVWTSRENLSNNFLLLAGNSLLFVGFLNLAHTLSFQGMQIFSGVDSNLPDQSYLAARYFEGISLLLAILAIRLRRVLTRFEFYLAFTVYLGITFLLFGTIFLWKIFPVAMTDSGNTFFYLASEYAITGIFLLCLAGLWRVRRHFEGRVFRWLAAATASLVISEALQTSLLDAFAISNFLAHLFNVLVFYLFYRAVNQTGVVQPQALLFRELQEKQDALALSQAKLKAILNNTTQGYILMDRQGIIQAFNNEANAFARLILGRPMQEGASMQDYVPDRDRPDFWNDFQHALAGKPAYAEKSFTLAENKMCWYAYSYNTVYDDNRQMVGVCLNTEDISERMRIAEELVYLGTHDPLTGLYNRSFFEEEMRRLQAGRHFPVSILIGDLDNLKEVNDRHGHAAGDELLKATAATMKDCFRTDDLIARVGGDEFVILLPGVAEEETHEALERLNHCLESYNSQHTLLPIRISFGVATGEKGTSLEIVLHEADQRMYAVKRDKKENIAP
jgi:diguanylate cyclase (GGDEF)-like protein/PAS domain S-box-containing protein